MLMLLISTSGAAASAALSRDGAVLRRAVSPVGLTHSETIMPLIDSLFDDGGCITIAHVDAVGADIGPGSFTGVRIGVCIANSIAMALGKPAVGVSSLEALARRVSGGRPVCALIDARNSNGYAALYRDGDAIMEPTPVTVGELIKKLPADTVFTGDGAGVYGKMIADALPNASFADEGDRLLSADMLVLPAYERLTRGETRDELTPLYLRPTQAERVYKERERAK